MIRKVWVNNFNGQMGVTIPDSNGDEIVAGDFVLITKVRPRLMEGKCIKCSKKYVDHTIIELFEHGLIDNVCRARR